MKVKIIIYILAALIIFSVCWLYKGNMENKKKPIRVGILHSLTGTMAISEKAVVDATLLAIDEINAAGGVMGKRIEPVIADGASEPSIFAREAERLIKEEKVSVVFGCWTSACRKTVKPIFEKYNSLLFYPVQYEGLEDSPNIIYTGAVPNQQIIPAVAWAFENLGKKFFLVGSDYVFPRMANEIIHEHVRAIGGDIVGEEYLLLGSTQVDTVIAEIIRAKPDVILNTINGDSNIAFFRELRKAGITSINVPTISFSIGENELESMNIENMVGDYASWNYFQTINTPENFEFVRKYREKYGAHSAVNDPMEAAYFGVHMWANAVAEVGSDALDMIFPGIQGQRYVAPEGIIGVDRNNNHTWKRARIGKIRSDGQFEILWSSENEIFPDPYPVFKTKKQWKTLLESLYEGWGNKWNNPGK